jgi:hypothetical protein
LFEFFAYTQIISTAVELAVYLGVRSPEVDLQNISDSLNGCDYVRLCTVMNHPGLLAGLWPGPNFWRSAVFGISGLILMESTPTADLL